MSDIRLDIPDITVVIDKGDEYKVIVNNPHTVVKNVTGSLLRYADIAGFANTALTASYVAGGTVDSASYAAFAVTASYAANANIPAGVVSASSQVQLNQISGTTFNTQSYTFPQNLNVGGTLSANTLLVSSSIIYSSGSTKFGDSPDDTHQFTGSVLVDGPVIAPSFTGSFQGDGSQLTGIVSTLQITGSTGEDTIDLKTQGLLITGSNGINTVVTDNTVTIIAPQGTVSSSAQIDVRDTTGIETIATTGSNDFYGQQRVFGELQVHAGNLVITEGNTLIASGAIFAQNEIIGGFVSASRLVAESITGSFQGDGSQLTGLVTDLRISGSVGSDTVSLLTDDLTITGQNGIVTTITDNTVTIDVPNALTASLYGTASVAEGVDIIFAGNFETGDEPPIALQIGGTGNVISASYALTASYAENAILPIGVISSSTQVIYTQIPNIPLGMISTSAQFNALTNTTASYALTASYVANLPSFDTGSFAVTASNLFTGDQNFTNNNVIGDTITSTLNGTPIQINYGITKGDIANRFGGIKIKNYQWSGTNLASQIEFWTDSEAQDFSTRRFYIDGFGKSAFTSNVEVTGSLSTTGGINTPSVTNPNGNLDLITTGNNVRVLSSNFSVVNGGISSAFNVVANTAVQTPVLNNSGNGVSINDNVSVTGSFTVSGSSTLTNIGPAIFSGSLNVTNGITASLQGTSSWAQNVKFNNLSGLPTGLVSSSTQVVDSINGQTITPLNINATGTISGSSIQASGNSSIGGNLTVTGTLTAASQSIQYVTSSQFNVTTNKIIVNTNQSLQFGGISVIDSGSSTNTGSLYWDSINNHWLYENVSGAPYNSAILIAGPKNTDALGQERGLIEGRVPTATGDDHIDTAPQSSSIRVDFASGRTDIEHGLYVTGSLDATGTVRLAGIPSSSGQIQALLPNGIISSSGQITSVLPAGTISSSTQVDYNSIQNKLSGVVSSSTQVQPLLPDGTVSSSVQTKANLPDGTVSSSAQYPGWVTSSTQVNTGSFSGSFTGTLTGTITSASYAITASYAQSATATVPAGTVSSSTQVKADLPDGVVSSSAQYPGWVTSSTQIVWSSVNYNNGIVSSSAQVKPLLPGGVVSSSTQTKENLPAGTVSSSLQFNTLTTPFTGSYTGSFTGLINSASYVSPAGLPGGLISSSTQVASLGTIRLQVATNRSNAAAFYFNANTRTAADSASPGADTAFLIQSTGLNTVTVYLRQDNAGPNATLVGVAKNANGTAFSGATLVTSSSLSLTQDTIHTYTFSGLTLNQFDAIHIYCDPTSTPGTLYGVVLVS